MNKVLTAALLASVLAAGSAMAQSATTTTNTSTTTPAIATPGVESQTLAAPVPGANSFTESQARERLQAHGYADVSGLKLDDQQIWRGKATKNGTSVNVALDYQGNIVSQ